MSLPPQSWHERFSRQARWTQALRSHFYTQLASNSPLQIIEIGCGSGVILNELLQLSQAKIFGLDIDSIYLRMAMRNLSDANLFQADAHKIPLASANFDVCLCHFFLLWVFNPLSVLREMVRITRPGGIVCALAEPDYGGRIDFPPDLTALGQYQSQALSQQGANPEFGRQLRSYFTRVGLRDVVTGVLGGQWQHPFDPDEWESEWQVLQNDLAQFTDVQETLKKQKAQDRSAWVKGERILYVPTFYAWGRVAS